MSEPTVFETNVVANRVAFHLLQDEVCPPSFDDYMLMSWNNGIIKFKHRDTREYTTIEQPDAEKLNAYAWIAVTEHLNELTQVHENAIHDAETKLPMNFMAGVFKGINEELAELARDAWDFFIAVEAIQLNEKPL